MTKNIADLIKYRIGQAAESLEVAEEMAAGGHLKHAVNQAYYSMFYCGLALLASKQLSGSKHIGVIRLFTLHFIKTGLFPVSSGKHLADAFELRQRCDYREFTNVSSEQVRESINNARDFFEKTNRYIEKITDIHI